MINCVGIILDGNRRWAREKGLSTFEGHKKGLHDALFPIVLHASDKVPHLVVYAFSTENWNRSEEEVTYLMDLFKFFFKKYVNRLSGENIKIRVIGQRDRFSPEIQKLIQEAEEKTKNNTKMTFWIALSYGGRAEILEAVEKACTLGVHVKTEEDFKKLLWTAEMPDPDIVIRTGGEKRLSNFLLWSIAYSELFFLDKYWPDFTEQDFDDILKQYETRQRRRGR